MRVSFGTASSTRTPASYFGTGEPSRCPQGVHAARAADLAEASGRSEGRPSREALAGHPRREANLTTSSSRSRRARRRRAQPAVHPHRVSLRIRISARSPLSRRRTIRRAAGAPIRLVWGPREIDLEPGENLIGRDRGRSSGSTTSRFETARANLHRGRRRVDRGSRQQERNLPPRHAGPGRRALERPRRRRIGPATLRLRVLRSIGIDAFDVRERTPR
jgi:hypothetical protein